MVCLKYQKALSHGNSLIIYHTSRGANDSITQNSNVWFDQLNNMYHSIALTLFVKDKHATLSYILNVTFIEILSTKSHYYQISLIFYYNPSNCNCNTPIFISYIHSTVSVTSVGPNSQGV